MRSSVLNTLPFNGQILTLFAIIQEVEVLDKDLYRSRSLWRPSSGRGVFGGQTIAQATWAATLSVLEDTPDLGK